MTTERFPIRGTFPCASTSHGRRRLLPVLLLALSAVFAQARPANDHFADAALITGESGTTDGNNLDATHEPDEPDHAGRPGGNSVWWQWTAPDIEAVIFDSFGSDFDTLLAVYIGTSVDSLTLVTENDDSGDRSESLVGFLVNPGTTYYIALDGYDGEQGTIVLNWRPTVPPANDHFADAIVIAGASGSDAGSNFAATHEPAEPSHANEPARSSVWWEWTAPAGGTVAIDTFGSAFDTVLALYTGISIDTLTLVADNDDSAGTLQSEANFTAVAGTVYRIAVDGYLGDQGAITLNWRPTSPPVNDHLAAASVITGVQRKYLGRQLRCHQGTR
jgi:hypothetical protein